jgi:hypothetical protein
MREEPRQILYREEGVKEQGPVVTDERRIAAKAADANKRGERAGTEKIKIDKGTARE